MSKHLVCLWEEVKVSRTAGSSTPLLAGKDFLYSFVTQTAWSCLSRDVWLNPINHLSQPTCKPACSLHPHAANSLSVWFERCSWLEGEVGGSLMDWMDTLLVHPLHLLYVNQAELQFKICRAKTMISKYPKDTSFTACSTLLGTKLFASQRSSTNFKLQGGSLLRKLSSSRLKRGLGNSPQEKKLWQHDNNIELHHVTNAVHSQKSLQEDI